MFRKETIKESVSALPLQPGDYCVITGTALVMHGIKEETKDIDISCTKEAFQALAAQGFPIKQGAFARKVVFSDDVEIFEDWHTGVITMVEGVPEYLDVLDPVSEAPALAPYTVEFGKPGVAYKANFASIQSNLKKP